MVRPRLRRRIRFNPRAVFFKPQGIPMSMLEIESLSYEEMEALRLRHLKNMEQEEVAKEMKTSRPTIQRILASGHKKIISALVRGRAIAIEKKL